jgi:hypothetical protein
VNSLELLEALGPVVMSPKSPTLLGATYTEDRAKVEAVLRQHPTLFLYTVSSWAEETWIHRGERSINRLGYVLGTRNQEPRFAAKLDAEVAASLS